MISTISLKSYLVNAYLDQRQRKMHASYDRLDGTMLLIVMIMIDAGEDDMIMMIVKKKNIHTYIHSYCKSPSH